MLPAYVPERLTLTTEPKLNRGEGYLFGKYVTPGWAGGRKVTPGRIVTRIYCGVCTAEYYATEQQHYLEGDNAVNENEFYEQLAALATMENGARMDALDAEKRKHDRARAGPRAKTGAVTPAKNNGAKPGPVKTKAKRTISDLPCGCKPYIDVKTFIGWRAEGRRVFVDGRARRAWPKGPSCYCRCFTEPIPAKERVAA